MDLNHLRTFQRVAALGSFAEAARKLGVPTSTVSRHVRRLEESLGVDLVVRGPRTVSVTEAGDAVLARSKQPLEQLQQLASELPTAVPQGTLRIAAPSNVVLRPAFASMLADFRRAYPDIEFDVDFSGWMSTSFSEGYDVAFRPFSTVRDTPDLMVRRLRALRLGLYASPSYVEFRGGSARIGDLHDWDMIMPRFIERQVLTLHRGKRVVELQPRVAFVGDDLSFVVAMVRAGAGFAIVPETDASVESGDLKPVLPGWQLAPLVPAMVWTRGRFTPLRVRLFLEFAAARLG